MKTNKRQTRQNNRQGKGLGKGVIILLVLCVVLTSGYIIYDRYIKKNQVKKEDELAKLVNNPNNTGIPSEEERAKEGTAKETTIAQKTNAVEEFAKEFGEKVEYDKEKNVIGINLKNSESLEEGKKEDTGKEILHPMEVREKITKIIEGMGLVQIQLSMPEPIGETDATYVAIVKNTKGEYRSMQLRFVRNMDGNISKKIRFLSLAL
jgi:hypothetical protein